MGQWLYSFISTSKVPIDYNGLKFLKSLVSYDTHGNLLSAKSKYKKATNVLLTYNNTNYIFCSKMYGKQASEKILNQSKTEKQMGKHQTNEAKSWFIEKIS